jgi:hypothetical protein
MKIHGIFSENGYNVIAMGLVQISEEHCKWI